MTRLNQGDLQEASDLKPLFMIIIGAFFGSGAVPEGSPWIVGILGGLVGAALFFAVGNYIKGGTRGDSRGVETWNPYMNGWQAIIMVGAVVMPFVVAGVIVSLLVEALTAMEATWLVTFFATLGLAAAGLYLGRALRLGERTPPGAFVGFSYLLFTLTFVGFAVAGLAFSGRFGNEISLAAGSIAGTAIAFLIWIFLLIVRSAR